MFSEAGNELFKEEQNFSDVPEEEEQKCMEAESLSTLLLTSETQKQAHVSLESEDMHVEEEYNIATYQTRHNNLGNQNN